MKLLFSLSAALMLVVILFLSGCDDCKDGCCKEVRLLVEANTASAGITFTNFFTNPALSGAPDNVFYQYLGSNVQFFVAVENANICTKQHLNFDFGAYVSDVTPDRDLKIFGEVYWDVYDDELILYSGMPTQNHLYLQESL